MAKRNPSGPSRGRRASSPRSNSAGKSFTRKSDGAPYPRVAKSKTDRPTGRPNKEDSSDRPRKPPFARPGRGDRRNDSERSEKPFRGGSSLEKKKFNTDGPREKRPYKKTYDRESGTPRAFGRDSASGKPDSAKPSASRPVRNSAPPYKKGDIKRASGGGPEAKSDTRHKKFEERPVKKPFRPSGKPTQRAASGFDRQRPSPPAAVDQQGKIRLNKYIANSGVCSRREADNLITMGLISVNGKTITELGYKVNPGDEVRHESKILRAEKPVYILLNKPKGYLTTTADPQERNTVMHLIANVVKERVYPVGRLDRNTTGLLLLTNDGELAEKLMHPSYNVKKIYKVDLDAPLTKADAQRILDGVKLEEGIARVDDLAIISDDRKTIGLEIHIGWNRVVRRIFESLGYSVVKLDRSVFAGLNKKEISRGQWRFLKQEELVLLKHYK